MRIPKKLASAWLLLCTVCLSTPALAGRSCDAKKITPQIMESGLTLAEKTLNSLNASGHKVVFLARAGQDLSKYGVRYSHLGFAYQIDDGEGGLTWRVLHKLNECGTNLSAIYRQGLGEFFLDDLWKYEAIWIAPSPQVQENVLQLLLDRTRTLGMHHKPYSIVSYYRGLKYQQSNQWAIETLAAAMEPDVTSREKAQEWLNIKGYQPTTLALGMFTRLGARVTAANVAFDDHPNEKRFTDRIETVTVDSVFSWLLGSKLISPGTRPTLVRF